MSETPRRCAYSHAAAAVLNLVAMAALICSVLAWGMDRRNERSGA